MGGATHPHVSGAWDDGAARDDQHVVINISSDDGAEAQRRLKLEAREILGRQQLLGSPETLHRMDSVMTSAAGLGWREPPERDTILANVGDRLPWLLALMLVQSVSGYVVARYESLIQEHVIIASFLTMLVGGGGNSSGQTVAVLVRRLGTGEITSDMFWKVLFKESLIGLLLSIGLGLAAFPRVRYMHKGASNLDAFAISLSYTLIIVMANALAVCVTMLLHLFGRAAVGSPPVVQVIVDVAGISLSCMVCSAILQGE
ncbi:hypothetical protein T492DRAFT_1002478 [Pavlovales sp. CCMP2436]|nr:hypothetical protein T492DRAFT_1002478 [Pavlovales sp. CCMP2436]